MEKKSMTLLVLVASTVLCASAFAVESGSSESDIFPNMRPLNSRSEMSPSVGLMAGYSAASGPDFSNDASYLLDVGFQPYVPFSVGIQFQRTQGNIESVGANPDFNTNNYLLRANYNFGGDVPFIMHSYVGAKAGITQYSGDADTSSHFSIGPMLGFDIPVDREGHFTLGGEASYLAVLGDVGIADSAPDQGALLGAAKYWF